MTFRKSSKTTIMLAARAMRRCKGGDCTGAKADAVRARGWQYGLITDAGPYLVRRDPVEGESEWVDRKTIKQEHLNAALTELAKKVLQNPLHFMDSAHYKDTGELKAGTEFHRQLMISFGQLDGADRLDLTRTDELLATINRRPWHARARWAWQAWLRFVRNAWSRVKR